MPILQGHWRTERRFLACDWKRQAEAAAVFANDYCGATSEEALGVIQNLRF